MDLTLWNAVVSTATLLVVAAAALAALRQLRHLRAQTTLAGLLKVLEDWREPEFVRAMSYLKADLQRKLVEPGFLEQFDRPLDRAKHPELDIADWYEQVGSYLKHGLLEENILMDVSSSSANIAWSYLEPIILRMRATRNDALYENFEYMVARGILFERAHPRGCYPRDTPRVAALGGAQAFGRAIPAAPSGG